MNRSQIIIPCRHETCRNTWALHPDAAYVPQEWECPQCESALLEQQIEAMSVREQLRKAKQNADDNQIF